MTLMLPTQISHLRAQLLELTTNMGDLAKVVAGLVKLSADETLPAAQSGTTASRERAQFLRQATDVCQTTAEGLERLRKALGE